MVLGGVAAGFVLYVATAADGGPRRRRGSSARRSRHGSRPSSGVCLVPSLCCTKRTGDDGPRRQGSAGSGYGKRVRIDRIGAIAAALLCAAGSMLAVAQGTLNDALTRRAQAGDGQGPAARRRQGNRLRQRQEHRLGRRRRRAPLPGPDPAGRPGHLRPQDRPGLRRGQRPADRRERRRHRPATASSSPTTSRAASSIRSGSSRRSTERGRASHDPFLGAPRRARRRRDRRSSSAAPTRPASPARSTPSARRCGR